MKTKHTNGRRIAKQARGYALMLLCLYGMAMTDGVAKEKATQQVSAPKESHVEELVRVEGCQVTIQVSQRQTGRICELKRGEVASYHERHAFSLANVQYRRYANNSLTLLCHRYSNCIETNYLSMEKSAPYCAKKRNQLTDITLSPAQIDRFIEVHNQTRSTCPAKPSTVASTSETPTVTMSKLEQLEQTDAWKASCSNGTFYIIGIPFYQGGEYCGGYSAEFLCAKTPESAGQQLCMHAPAR